MIRWRAFAGRVLAASLVTSRISPAFATPSPPARPPASSPARPPVPPATFTTSAVGTLAAQIAGDLGAPAKNAWVFAGVLRSDEPAPRGAELGMKLVAAVASACGGLAQPEPMPLAIAQGEAKRAAAFVYLSIAIARGELRITAELYRTRSNVWDRAKQPALTPLGRSFAHASIDAEVRAYLAPVPLLTNHIDRVPLEDTEVQAIACGRARSDGELVIVMTGRRAISQGRVQGGRFVAQRTLLWKDLSPVAPSPLREPIAGIVILPGDSRAPTYIDVGISDRAYGQRFVSDLAPAGPLGGVPVTTASGDGCLAMRGTSLDGRWVPCVAGDANGAPAIPLPTDAAAETHYVSRDGQVRAIAVTRDPRHAQLLVTGDGASATLANSGAQLAIADLDQDGAPEILSTLDVMANGSTASASVDALIVSTWQAPGVLVPRARIDVPEGVRAVAACPPNGSGAAWVVLASPTELWIIR